MGAYSSTHLTTEEIDELVNQTNFDRKEIIQLYRRFKKLDRTRSGVLRKQDFQLIPELGLNPMAPRILSLFQTSEGEDALTVSGGVTFDVFVKALSQFHEASEPGVKLRALFSAYDVDGDGVVGEADLRHMLKCYTGPHLSDAVARVLVRKTMDHALGVARGADWAKASVDASAVPAEAEQGQAADKVRGLTFKEFSKVCGEEGIDLLSVVIPERDDHY